MRPAKGVAAVDRDSKRPSSLAHPPSQRTEPQGWMTRIRLPHGLEAATNEDPNSEVLFVAASNSWGTSVQKKESVAGEIGGPIGDY